MRSSSKTAEFTVADAFVLEVVFDTIFGLFLSFVCSYALIILAHSRNLLLVFFLLTCFERTDQSKRTDMRSSYDGCA